MQPEQSGLEKPASEDVTEVPMREDSPLMGNSELNSPRLSDERHAEVPEWMLWGLNCYIFAYGLVVSTMGLIILPTEAERLFPKQHAFMLGVMLGITGVSQLIAPVTGYLSDRCTSKLGRRRPFLILGHLVSLVGITLMYYARTHYLGGLYVAFLFFAILGLNLVYAAYTAISPDFIPASQRGRASGIMGMLAMIGSCTGFALFGFLLPASWSYLLYALVSTGTVILTVLVANEVPISESPAFSWGDIARSYTINRTTHHDFFWVFVVRTLYYMASSVQAFLLFYFRDAVGVSDPAHYVALLCLYSQFAASIVAYPSGKLSDYTGRKPMVAFACLSMSVVYLLFMKFYTLTFVLGMGFVYGFGNGVFLSVDYALALDALPSKDNVARDLGVWGVGAFIGSMLGGLVCGALLNFIGIQGGDHQHYHFKGYVAMLLAGTSFLVLAIFCLRFIKGSR